MAASGTDTAVADMHMYQSLRLRFWQRKFEDNLNRDERVRRQLQALRWRVVTVWECEVADAVRLRHRLKSLLSLR